MALTETGTMRGCMCEWSCEHHRGTHCHGVPVTTTIAPNAEGHVHAMLCGDCADAFDRRQAEGE